MRWVRIVIELHQIRLQEVELELQSKLCPPVCQRAIRVAPPTPLSAKATRKPSKGEEADLEVVVARDGRPV